MHFTFCVRYLLEGLPQLQVIFKINIKFTKFSTFILKQSLCQCTNICQTAVFGKFFNFNFHKVAENLLLNGFYIWVVC